jgi:hypothetical protein
MFRVLTFDCQRAVEKELDALPRKCVTDFLSTLRLLVVLGILE